MHVCLVTGSGKQQPWERPVASDVVDEAFDAKTLCILKALVQQRLRIVHMLPSVLISPFCGVSLHTFQRCCLWVEGVQLRLTGPHDLMTNISDALAIQESLETLLLIGGIPHCTGDCGKQCSKRGGLCWGFFLFFLFLLGVLPA